MLKTRIFALAILLAGLSIGYFLYASEAKLHGASKPWGSSALSGFSFKLGLDLSGGTHLIYRADVSKVAGSEVKNAMDALRDVIERRVNLFGVSEPLVQLESGGFAGNEQRLIIQLPGVTDVNQAVTMIGQTPLLEFKTERPNGAEKDSIIKAIEAYQKAKKDGKEPAFDPLLLQDPGYISTELTGRFLEKATLDFDQQTGEPTVGLQFNSEGTKLFADITKSNVGKTVAIYLDNAPISSPVVREEIASGKAQISGNFTPQEAKTLVGRLNSGALPVPIELISTQTIGAPLGEKALNGGVKAGLLGLLAVAIFLIAWYRLPGLVAVIALGVYVVIMLAVFKLIPITLTAAGIAGFILSVGMAVDANILVAERTKEELRNGRDVIDAIKEGFSRAWSSIRDSNISSMITGVMLFWFGTSLIQGFALTFLLGVLISMFSAITVTRTFLFSLGVTKRTKLASFLFSSGFNLK
ncbi:MAG: protein translocase subunit SecD [Candidatus Paceibacterota bacterium]|jgi:protein-export membrane protein SecD